MAAASPEQVAHYRRAEARAREVLKPGDRIRVGRCAGLLRTYTFASWDGHWIVSASGIDDLSAYNIDRVNGAPVSFRDPE